MTPAYEENGVTIYQGHVTDVLRALPPASVHCVITSPPYWALRNYKLEPLVWGGALGCVHAWDEEAPTPSRADLLPASFSESASRIGRDDRQGLGPASGGYFCTLCGAWRGSLGLEPTPDLYVAHIVEIFRAVRRVLRHDGTVWLNLGDCYVKGKPRGNKPGEYSTSTLTNPWRHEEVTAPDVGFRPDLRDRDALRRHRQDDLGWTSKSSFRRDRRAREDNAHQDVPGLKPKDLVGIPWMVAFALRDDGWYLRQDNVWWKKNPMPESAYDRTTRAHEYLFHLSKSEDYYYDRVATFEPRSKTSHARSTGVHPKAAAIGDKASTREPKQNARFAAAMAGLVPVRNKRSVWHLATQAFKGAHFATFPEKLVEPCILAGTSAHGTCSYCGAPYRRVVRRHRSLKAAVAMAAIALVVDATTVAAVVLVVAVIGGAGNWNPGPGSNRGMKVNAQRADRKGDGPKFGAAAEGATPRPDPAGVNLRVNLARARADGGEHDHAFGYIETIGWRRTCRCALFGELGGPCTVLDPFGGRGTTGLVARRLGRRAILIELSGDYIDLAVTSLKETSS